MKYPFSPEILDALPEELADLFRELEMTLLKEICSRLNAKGQFNEVTVQAIRALRSHGISVKEIKKAIQKTANIADADLEKLFDEVVEQNQKYYTKVINLETLTAPEISIGVEDTWALYQQTKNELKNITRSMGFLVDNGRTMLAPAKAYQWALDNAAMQIQSGAISYNQAIKSAVQQLADSGLKKVDYESGHVDSVDVAVRRAVMTGVNQLNRRYAEQAIEELETDLVEVSAHTGARDTGIGVQNHKDWQGKVYRWRRYTQDFPNASKQNYADFENTCGYGDVQGILGANCRHNFSPFVEGIMERTYTDEELAHIDDHIGGEYDGKTYTAYEATQMQRRLERTIRKQKRRVNAYKEAGLKEDAQTAQARLNRLNEKYREFSEEMGMKTRLERTHVTFEDDAASAESAALKARREAEAPVREAIKSGKYPLTINPEKQAIHIQGTAKPGRSVVTISADELQEIINAKAGSGKILFQKGTFIWQNREIIDAGKEIGFTVNKDGDIIPARSLKIHYSKTGTHAVPRSKRWKK